MSAANCISPLEIVHPEAYSFEIDLGIAQGAGEPEARRQIVLQLMREEWVKVGDSVAHAQYNSLMMKPGADTNRVWLFAQTTQDYQIYLRALPNEHVHQAVTQVLQRWVATGFIKSATIHPEIDHPALTQEILWPCRPHLHN